jgi:integrase
MAIRYRAGRKSPWQVYWNNPHTGRRECASFATETEAKKENSLIAHRLKHEREFFTKESSEPESRHITLEAVYLQYLKAKQFSKKDLYWQMDSMRTPLQMLGSEDISKITTQRLEAVIDELKQKGVKPITVRVRASVLRAVIRWGAAQGYCEPVAFPKLPPAQCKKFVPPTPEELSLIMMHAPSHIQRVVILGSQLGVRVGPCELLRLTWADVDFSRASLRVHGSKKNKSQPWREVPIRQSLVPIFKEWHAEDGHTAGHIVHFRGSPVQSIKTSWNKTLKRAGITRRIRPYDLRHAFATEAIAAGVDVGTVSKLMGHTTPTMVLKHYQHVLDQQKRAAVETLPEVQYVPKEMCPKEKALSGLQ